MKRCAVVNDISGFGRCSLTAAIPIISSLGIQANPVVTGVFTNQTGYDSYKFHDLTNMLPSFCEEWKKLGATFDGILTGFLLTEHQCEHIENFVDNFKTDKTLLLVDPVLGDDGKLYDCFNESLVESIKRLVKKADIITPNITELKLLSGEEDLETGAKKLLSTGIKSVIVTGIIEEDTISCLVFSDNKIQKHTTKLIRFGGKEAHFSGTGDIFSSIVMGKMLSGCSVFKAAKQAVDFIGNAIRNTNVTDRNDGIDFEKFLKDL